MVKNCLVCGTLNDDFTLRCTVCGAELTVSTQSSDHLFSPPQTIQGTLNPFHAPLASNPQHSKDPFVLDGDHLGGWQVHPDGKRSLSITPYIATASKGPSDDGFLGPEDVALSFPPLSVSSTENDTELPREREGAQTWVGVPITGSELEFVEDLEELSPSEVGLQEIPPTDLPASVSEIHEPPQDNPPSSSHVKVGSTFNFSSSSGNQNQEFPLVSLTQKSDLLEAKNPFSDGPETAVGYQSVVDDDLSLSEIQNHLDLSQNHSSTSHQEHTHKEPHTPQSPYPDSAQGPFNSLELQSLVHTQNQRNQDHLEKISLSPISSQIIPKLNSNSLDQSPSSQNLAPHSTPFDAIHKATTPSTAEEDFQLLLDEGHTLQPPSLVSSPSWVERLQSPWILMFFGLISTVLSYLFLVSQNQIKIQSQLDTPRLEGNMYQAQLYLKTNTPISFQTPDGWISNQSIPQVQIDTEATLKLNIPKESLKLGENLLRFSYTSQDDQEVYPINIPVDLLYEVQTVENSQNGQYSFQIRVAPSWTLVASNALFKRQSSANQTALQSYQISMPLSQSKQNKTTLEIEFTFENKEGLRKISRLTHSIDLKELPLELFTPNRHYSRPEKQVRLIGKTVPFAQIQVENISYTSNENGIFDLLYTLSKPFENHVKFNVSALGYQSKDLSLTLNRASAKKWWKRRGKLKKRGKTTRKAYPLLKYKALKNKKQPLKGKRGRVFGQVGWLNRNDQAEDQIALLFLCQPASCPIWVTFKHAEWITIGEKVSVFGVVEDSKAFSQYGSEPRLLPTMRARLITP